MRGKPSDSARRTYSEGFGEVMKRLLRSTGVWPPAYRTSTGMVVVKPTRVMSVPSDEEEVDHDDDDQKGADGEHQQVRVHGRLPLG